MPTTGREALRSLVVAVMCVAALTSCASSARTSDGGNDKLATTETSRKTQQEVQSELMAFADRYFATTLESAKTLEKVLDTPESRYTAAGARLVALVVTTDIAASPNPGAALLDMTDAFLPRGNLRE